MSQCSLKNHQFYLFEKNCLPNKELEYQIEQDKRLIEIVDISFQMKRTLTTPFCSYFKNASQESRLVLGFQLPLIRYQKKACATPQGHF